MIRPHIYPHTDAGLRAARATWSLMGGWLVELPDGYHVTDDPGAAAGLISRLTGCRERARFIAEHPDLAAADPPHVCRQLVQAMCGAGPAPSRGTSRGSGQLSLFEGQCP
jgi:hypothetical protein